MSDARTEYREAAVRGATPLRLVVILYEQVLEDLRRALAALESHDIEARTRAIDHALVVIGHLQATLNAEQGGEVARNLERFYRGIRKALLEAQCSQSSEILQEQIAAVTLVHDAWLQIEPGNNRQGMMAPALATAPEPAEGSERPRNRWNV